MTRYRCVAARKAQGFDVTAACAAAGVSTSAFYAWAACRDDGPSAKEQQEAALLADLRAIHADDDSYGAPRMTVALRRKGWRVNHKRVADRMATHGLAGHRPAKRRSLTKPDPAAPPVPDLVGAAVRPRPRRCDLVW